MGDRRLSAAEVGAQCQVYLRMWREAVDIGCWESLCGWRRTEDPELVSYEHNGKFAVALCLLWFNFKAAHGKICGNHSVRIVFFTPAVSSACMHTCCLRACACAFQSFYLCFPEISDSDSGDSENTKALDSPHLWLCVDRLVT